MCSRIPTGVPGRGWLRRLVAPLEDANLGAVTTFRWFFKQTGGFWSAMASAWNAPVATYLGDHGRNFCWGGGTAIRRERFEQCNVIEFWNGSVSDDFSLTHALRQAGLADPVRTRVHGPHPVRLRRDGTARIHQPSDHYHPRLRIKTVAPWRLAHALYCGAVFWVWAFFRQSVYRRAALHF